MSLTVIMEIKKADIQYTPAQLQALEAEGNLLIAAGAGAGKTRTLVDRAIREVIEGDSPRSLDELLLVTFTEAAAAEIRDRIRRRLDDLCEDDPNNARLSHQLTLVDQARISTLHQFCLEVIRERFDELALDPEFTILSETDAHVLQEEILNDLFLECYESDDAVSKEALSWIRSQGRGLESNLRDVILQINNYARTLPSPKDWIQEQREYLENSAPEVWMSWWRESVTEFLKEWKVSMEALDLKSAEDPVRDLHQTLEQATGDLEYSDTTLADVLRTLSQFYDNQRHGQKGKVKAWKNQMTQAGALYSMMGEALDFSPLKEDWEMTRHSTLSALILAERFMNRFMQTRKDAGWVDFQDLEQYALQALMDDHGQPKEAALEWRGRLARVFVDEYQDINAAQDAILRMVSRDGKEGNRFLVGDVKQSIYRFRLADPRIFQTYYKKWTEDANVGRRISLQDNFRSHEAILNYVNDVFQKLFHTALGGVAYDKDAKLIFGARDSRPEMSVQADRSSGVRVELHLPLQPDSKRRARDEASDESSASASSSADADDDSGDDDLQEATWIAQRLRDFKNSKTLVGEGTSSARPVDWGDMVVLVRSPKRNAEKFLKAFNAEGIPLIANTGGFLASRETQDLLALLKLLDNPLQDVPTLSVLRSPFGQITSSELAEIRTRSDKERFWDAFLDWTQCDLDSEDPFVDLQSRSQVFVERYNHWRRVLRKGSIAGCLETAIQEVDYESWFLGLDNAPERIANVRRMIGLASDFDRRYRKGLFRFLKYIEVLEITETDLMPTPPPSQGAVRLMSVHQSKGLEFPIVVVADLARRFNLTDLRQTVILDERYGLCSRVMKPGSHSRYPSLPYRLARTRQKRETLGEELRLLYVALTRASERLILFGSSKQSSFEKFLEDEEDSRSTDLFHVESKSSWLQWLLMASPIFSDHEFQSPDIGSRTFGWGILSPQKQTDSNSDSSSEEASSSNAEDSPDLQSQGQDDSAGSDWAARMEWSYPYQEGSRLPGKTSVSRIKSALIQQTEDNAEAPNPWENDELGEIQESPSAQPPAPLPFHSMPPQRSAAENQQLELPMEELESADKDKEQEKEEAKEKLESSPQKISGADRGLALHRLMERYPFDQDLNPKEQLAFAKQLNEQGILSEEQLQALDWRGIHWFLKSELGLQIISNAKAEANRIRREVPFTWWSDLAKLSQMGWKKEAILGAATLEASSSISGANKAPSPPILLNEEDQQANPDHVVIQGVMDLVVLLENECWLIDYKTDRFPISQLQEKQEEHAPQLKVYQRALADLTGNKVTRALLVFIHARKVVSVI